MEEQILNEKQQARLKKAEALDKALNEVAALLEPGQQINSLTDLGLILKKKLIKVLPLILHT